MGRLNKRKLLGGRARGKKWKKLSKSEKKVEKEKMRVKIAKATKAGNDHYNQGDINALISSESYKKPSERTKVIQGHTYDAELSDKHNAVYSKGSGKGSTAIHGVRGTVPTSGKDLLNDVLIGVGLSHKSNRHKKTKNLHNRVIEKHGKTRLTGHSLGGKLAGDVAKETNSKAVVFNPGKGLGDITSDIRDRIKPKRQSATNRVSTVRSRGDAVSMLGTIAGKKKNTKTTKGFSHGVDQFIKT